MSDFNDRIRPHAKQIMQDARDGSIDAQAVIDAHDLWRAVPHDHAAAAICESAFEAWLASKQEAPRNE